jgi:hypothetical protein
MHGTFLQNGTLVIEMEPFSIEMEPFSVKWNTSPCNSFYKMEPLSVKNRTILRINGTLFHKK